MAEDLHPLVSSWAPSKLADSKTWDGSLDKHKTRTATILMKSPCSSPNSSLPCLLLESTRCPFCPWAGRRSSVDLSRSHLSLVHSDASLPVLLRLAAFFLSLDPSKHGAMTPFQWVLTPFLADHGDSRFPFRGCVKWKSEGKHAYVWGASWKQ